MLYLTYTNITFRKNTTWEGSKGGTVQPDTHDTCIIRELCQLQAADWHHHSGNVWQVGLLKPNPSKAYTASLLQLANHQPGIWSMGGYGSHWITVSADFENIFHGVTFNICSAVTAWDFRWVLQALFTIWTSDFWFLLEHGCCYVFAEQICENKRFWWLQRIWKFSTVITSGSETCKRLRISQALTAVDTLNDKE